MVEVPAAAHVALYGTLISSWGIPLINVGNEGEDQGKGGRYLLLAPGYDRPVAPG